MMRFLQIAGMRFRNTVSKQAGLRYASAADSLDLDGSP